MFEACKPIFEAKLKSEETAPEDVVVDAEVKDAK
jgi:hypothetical protein